MGAILLAKINTRIQKAVAMILLVNIMTLFVGQPTKGHFVEDCPNKPTPKAKKKACKAKALTTIKTLDDSSSE